MNANLERTLSLTLGIVVLSLVMTACADPAAEAREALDIDDLTRARAILEPAVDGAPRSLELRVLLLEVHERAGDWDRAVETARVVARLDSSTVYTFRLMYARARSGEFTELQRQLDSWPDGLINEMFANALLKRGLSSSPGGSEETHGQIVRRARATQPLLYNEAAAELGVPYYRAASVLALIHQGVSEENYDDAGDIAEGLSDLRTTAPDLAAEIRPLVALVLKSLPEPDTPRSTGIISIDEGYRKLYWGSMERHYIALGDLEAAIDPTDQGVRRAVTAYRIAQEARDMGSSPESVGGSELGEMAKCMVEGDFEGSEGPKAIRFFGGEFQFVVQALDNAGGYGATSAEPVEQEFAVTA